MSSRFDLRESDNVFNEFNQFKQEALRMVQAESDKSKEHNFENPGSQPSGEETPSGGGGGGERRCLLQHRLPPLITSVPVMEIRRTCDAIIAKNESRGYHNVSFLRVDQTELQNVKPTLNGISSTKLEVKNSNGKSAHEVANQIGEKENFFTGHLDANSYGQLGGIPMLRNGYCSQNLKSYNVIGDSAESNSYVGQSLMTRDVSGETSAVNLSNQIPNPYTLCSNTDMLMSVINPASVSPVPYLSCHSGALIANDSTLARPQDIQPNQCKELVQPTSDDCCCYRRYACLNKTVDDKCQCYQNQVGHCSTYHSSKRAEQASEEDCNCNKRNLCRSHFKYENKSNADMREECCCSQGDHQNFKNWRSDLGCWAYPSYSSQCCSKRNNNCCDCDSYSFGPSSSNSLCLAPYDPRQVNNKEVAPSLSNFNNFNNFNDYPIQDLLEALRMNQMALSIGVRPPMDDLPDDYKCCCEKDSRYCENSSERPLWNPEDERTNRFSRSSSRRSCCNRRMTNCDMSSDENEASEVKINPFSRETSRVPSRLKSRRPLKKIVVDWGDKNQYNFCHDLDPEGLTNNHCNCGISNMIRAKRKIASRCAMKNYENYR